jgi:hypothetical protein
VTSAGADSRIEAAGKNNLTNLPGPFLAGAEPNGFKRSFLANPCALNQLVNPVRMPEACRACLTFAAAGKVRGDEIINVDADPRRARRELSSAELDLVEAVALYEAGGSRWRGSHGEPSH